MTCRDSVDPLLLFYNILILCFNYFLLKVSINGIELGLTGATALTGANVMPCIGHPCNSEKDAEDICGTHGMCKPNMADYFCNCPLYFTGDRCENVRFVLD